MTRPLPEALEMTIRGSCPETDWPMCRRIAHLALQHAEEQGAEEDACFNPDLPPEMESRSRAALAASDGSLRTANAGMRKLLNRYDVDSLARLEKENRALQATNERLREALERIQVLGAKADSTRIYAACERGLGGEHGA